MSATMTLLTGTPPGGVCLVISLNNFLYLTRVELNLILTWLISTPSLVSLPTSNLEAAMGERSTNRMPSLGRVMRGFATLQLTLAFTLVLPRLTWQEPNSQTCKTRCQASAVLLLSQSPSSLSRGGAA